MKYLAFILLFIPSLAFAQNPGGAAAGVGDCIGQGKVVGRINANSPPTCVSGTGTNTVTTSGPLSGNGSSGSPVTLPSSANITISGLTSTGPTSITGNQTNGSDQINSVSVAGRLNVMTYGAACNGTTDDSTAINAAAVAAQGHATLYFPENKTCAAASEIVLNMVNGPISVAGGKNSILLLTGTANKGIHATGTPGSTGNPLVISGLTIRSNTSGTSPALIHLDGIARFVLEDLYLDGNGATTDCIFLTAAQQGEIRGSVIQNCVNGEHAQIKSGITNNGIDTHGNTFFSGATTQIGGLLADASSIDDGEWHGNHVTGNAATVFLMDFGGGLGVFNITDNHFEPTTTHSSTIVRGGQVNFRGNADYTNHSLGANSIEVAGGANTVISENILDGNLVLDAGTSSDLVSFNYILGNSIDNSTASSFLLNRTIGNGYYPDGTTSASTLLHSQLSGTGIVTVAAAITPQNLSVTPTGGAATQYCYRVACLVGGLSTQMISEVCDATGPTTLDTSHYETVAITYPQAGCDHMQFAGRATGAELKTSICPGGTGCQALTSGHISWRDDGAVTPSGALPSSNSTGVLGGTTGIIDVNGNLFSSSFSIYDANLAAPSTNYAFNQNTAGQTAINGSEVFLRTGGTNRFDVTSAHTVLSTPLKLQSFTVATLPGTCVQGDMVQVTDATTINPAGGTCTGSGSSAIPAICSATNTWSCL